MLSESDVTRHCCGAGRTYKETEGRSTSMRPPGLPLDLGDAPSVAFRKGSIHGQEV